MATKNGSKAGYRTADPVIAKMKEQIADKIAEIISKNEMTQMQAGIQMGIAPSQVSLITTKANNLRGFSLENLILCISALGRNVGVKVSKSAGNGKGKITAQIA